ncbi:hypothetical protein Agabi119p4_5609 [Agaricus bisporus var. burnettii]|uniref:DRBM domain-containing protein n=1 Tax=Agaricus bisporus var. burnettii TaxID=192524 RepID=A0A8H7KGK5_AGABI|nr:hypothetical protein Agabi119p4_5609 [Agaricus bisporus var. burnettii]
MSTHESGYMNKLNTVCNRQGWKLTKDEGVQSGPKHQPVWTGHVYVNGKPFGGQGRSIAAAREAAAMAALDYYRAYNPSVVPSDF